MRNDVLFVFLMIICRRCLADYYHNYKYFCTNLNHQHIVDIGQLEGIWYLKEKIIHTEERHYVINMTTCPVIHITEDQSPSTTVNPLYKHYDTTYGSGYPYEANPNVPRYTVSGEMKYSKQQEEYDRTTTYDHQRRKIAGIKYINHYYAQKHLRIYWDQNNSYSIEYHVHFNETQPGFWISSGPEGRIQDDVKDFSGTIQVIKAVGDHLVLTFCHSQLEKNQLFTVILSREHHLDSREIHNVHKMLEMKGLNTNAIEKTCNKAPSNELSLALGLFVLGIYTVFFVK